MRQAFRRLCIAWLLLLALPVIGRDQVPTPRVDVTTSPATLVPGRSASFDVVVSGNAGDPVATGEVALLDGDALVTSAPLTAGRATLSLPTVVTQGNHFYLARYSGDTFYRAATSAGVTLNRAGDVILARCPAIPDAQRCINLDGWLGATVLPRGGAVPTGTISLRRDGVVFQTQPLANGRADFPPALGGPAGIVAEYSGDANHAASVSAPLSDDPLANAIRIGDLVLTSEPFPATTGISTRFTATSITGTDTLVIGAPVPDAVYTFTVGDRQIAVVADATRGFASVEFTASASDASVQAVRTPVPGPIAPEYGVGRAVMQRVSLPVPVVGMVTTPFPLVAGQAATFEITVGAAAFGTPAPSGNVELRDGGATGEIVGTSPLDASGAATVTLPSIPTGNHFYVARYVGDARYGQATSPGVTVNRTGDVILARCPADAGPDFVQCQGQPDKLAVTVIPRSGILPTGQVTLKEGSRFVESASLISGRADFTTLASSITDLSTLVVEYGGDATYPASVSSPFSASLQIGDVVLTSEPFPAQVGVLTRFTATTISGVPVPDATYTFAVDGTLIRAVADSSQGSASVEYTPQTGNTVVTAERAPANGDINYTVSQVTSMKLTGDALGGGGDGGGGGCFIATAAYGSYLHPHVRTLRDFRDQVLMASSVGRSIIQVYYRYSPALAQHIERDPAAKIAARLALTPLVLFIAYPASACVILLMLIAMIAVVRSRHAMRLRA